MKPPFERFLEKYLQQFGKERKRTLAMSAAKERIRGAEQFVAFLLGRAPKKHERVLISAFDTMPKAKK